MAECLEGEARVVVLAARRDALILLSVEELGEDDGGDGEEDEAEELVVDAEDEAGAVAVEALVNLNSIERWKGKGGQRRELFDSDFCMILAGLVLSGRCTYHGEGGEGLRDEAGDRGGEHSLLGHGSLGDGGLGDWIRRGIRGLGISSDRGNLVERARAGTNSRRGGFDRFARFAIGWFGCTHRWPCGQPCGPRALREGGERGEGSRSALASSPDRARG